MATTKITKRDYFTALRAFVNEGTNLPYSKVDVIDFIDNELALLEKKSSRASTKPSKTQEANEGIKAAILDIFRNDNTPLTISELMKKPGMEGLSNQKLSALAKQLVDAGELVKVIEKKKSYFTIPETEETEGDFSTED